MIFTKVVKVLGDFDHEDEEYVFVDEDSTRIWLENEFREIQKRRPIAQAIEGTLPGLKIGDFCKVIGHPGDYRIIGLQEYGSNQYVFIFDLGGLHITEDVSKCIPATVVEKNLTTPATSPLADDFKQSNLYAHAVREFELAGFNLEDDEEGPNKGMMENVLELLKILHSQSHSGFSASYTIHFFTKLADFKILSPLRGTDDEWNDRGDGLYQNKRCSHVFKEEDQVYDIEGKIFVDSEGSSYTDRHGRTQVTFPYTPEPEIVKTFSPEPTGETDSYPSPLN